MQRGGSRFLLATACGASLMLGAASTVHATVIGGSSSAFDAKARITVAGTPLNVGPFSQSSGTAPPPYDDPDQLAGLSRSAPGGQASVTTGLLETDASSNVDGDPGDRFAAADSAIDNLILNASGFGLNATTIASNAKVSGDFNALVPSGGATLEDARISVNGQSFALDANPDPNTDVLPSVLNPLGLDLVLNEQKTTGNGTDSQSIAVNALHLFFNDTPSGAGLLNGDLILSHSQAMLQAEPTAGGGGGPVPGNDVAAPAGWSMLALLGLGVLGIAAGKRKTSLDSRRLAAC